MNEPLNAPLGSVEDELKFALGGDVDDQLFDGDIDAALREAGGDVCDDDGSDPFALAGGTSRPASPGCVRGCHAGAPADPVLPTGHIRTVGYASPEDRGRGPYPGLSRLVSMPGDDRDGRGGTYVPLNDDYGGGDNMDPPSAPPPGELDCDLSLACLLQDDAVASALGLGLGAGPLGTLLGDVGPPYGRDGVPAPGPDRGDWRAPVVHDGTIHMSFRTNLASPFVPGALGRGVGGYGAGDAAPSPPHGFGVPGLGAPGGGVSAMPNLLDYDRFLAPFRDGTTSPRRPGARRAGRRKAGEDGAGGGKPRARKAPSRRKPSSRPPAAPDGTAAGTARAVKPATRWAARKARAERGRKDKDKDGTAAAAAKTPPEAVAKTEETPKTTRDAGRPAVSPDEDAPAAGPSRKEGPPSDGSGESPIKSGTAPPKSSKEAEGVPPAPPSPSSARLARLNRRRLRARCQVIDKHGGDLREIIRRAAADSDLDSDRPRAAVASPGRWTALSSGALGYAAGPPPVPGRDELLRAFAAGLDASTYVAGVDWGAVRAACAAGGALPAPASPPAGAESAATSAATTPAGSAAPTPAAGNAGKTAPAVVSPPAPSPAASAGLPAPVPRPPLPGKGNRGKRSRPEGPVVRGPNGRKMREVAPELHGVELPTGTDPETRRQRRLMRNRLTAQASRDRKRRAIEEARRARDEKEVEIEALRRTLRDENERLRSLESMLDLARRSMTQEQFARVTGMSTASGMATAIASSAPAGDGTGDGGGDGSGGGGGGGLPEGVATGV